MRAKEPLNGLRKAQGHIIYHVALLLTSLNCIKHKEKEWTQPQIDAREILILVRVLHAFIICSNLFRGWIQNKENRMFYQIIKAIENWVFILVFLYTQWFLLEYPSDKNKDSTYVHEVKLFLFIEVVMQYALIINVVIFLLCIQIRG